MSSSVDLNCSSCNVDLDDWTGLECKPGKKIVKYLIILGQRYLGPDWLQRDVAGHGGREEAWSHSLHRRCQLQRAHDGQTHQEFVCEAGSGTNWGQFLVHFDPVNLLFLSSTHCSWDSYFGRQIGGTGRYLQVMLLMIYCRWTSTSSSRRCCITVASTI